MTKHELDTRPNAPVNLIHILIVCLGLFIAAFALYTPVANHEFLAFDDEIHVTANEMVMRGLTFDGVVWAFTSGDTANWFPITRLSHMLDVQFFGGDPKGHHLMNVFLHALNGVLLFLFLARATRRLWPSMAVAALFAVHPLHVESVAWISERKDVLHAFFWILALIAYDRYVKSQSVSRYILVAVLFTLGFMAKPMIVTLPLTLLLLDLWPYNRFADEQGRVSARRAGELVLEKAPLFLLAGVFGVITILVQRAGGAMGVLDRVSLAGRLNNAALSYFRYAENTFWPLNLYFPHPHPGDTGFTAAGIAAVLGLLAITVATLFLARRVPYLAFGWLWFVVTLLPVVGLLQVGSQGMADRYMYMPIVGLFLSVCWFLADYVRGSGLRTRGLAVLTAALVAILSALTWQQIRHWHDTESLLLHAQVSNDRNAPAGLQLGVIYLRDNLPDFAEIEFRIVIEIDPESPQAHSGLGSAQRMLKRTDAAETSFRKAIELAPQQIVPYLNLGSLLLELDRTEEAIETLTRAVKLDPENMQARSLLDDANLKANE